MKLLTKLLIIGVPFLHLGCSNLTPSEEVELEHAAEELAIKVAEDFITK